MNPLLQSALGSILRLLLAGVAGWFVQKGVWTQDAANEYVAAAVIGLLTLGWSLWVKYRNRLKFLAALQAPPGTTEAAVLAQVKAGPAEKVTGGLAVILAFLLPFLSGCASTVGGTNTRHVVAVSSVGIGEAIFALDDAERALFAAGKLGETPAMAAENHRRFSQAAVPVLELGQAINKTVLAWRPGQPVPATLQQMLPALRGLVTTAIEALPGEPKASLLSLVAQVYDAVATVLAFMIG